MTKREKEHQRCLREEMTKDGIEIGDLVKWNGDKSGRIDRITSAVGGLAGGLEYYTIETNPQNGEKPKIGKQFYDRNGEYKDKGVGIIKIN